MEEIKEEKKEEVKEETKIEKTEVEILNEEIEKIKKELEESNGNYVRLSAEFQNFTKRKEKEMESLKEMASKRVIEKILPTFENLERALEAYKNVDENDPLYQGVKMTYSSFKNTLLEEGIEIFDPINEIYDPNFSEAMGTISDENLEDEVIVAVYSKGYKLKGKLLKTAKVQINKK